MASIKKHTAKSGAETWRVRYRNGSTSSSMTFPTEDGARQFGQMIDMWGAKKALEFINQPTEPRRHASGTTVSDCVKDYIAQRPNKNTQATYTRTFKTSIEPELGNQRIGQLDRRDIQLWLNGQEGSTETLRRNHGLLSWSLGEAVRRGELKANPATGVVIPRRAANPKRAPLSPPYTRQEYQLIRKAMHSRYQLFVEFLAETGCRLGEAAALTPADVNLARGTVHFNKSYSATPNGRYELGTTKTEGSDRIIRVKQSLLERLDLTGRYVFTTKVGERIKGGAFRTAHWQRALWNAGLDEHRWGHPHDLRHAHATWLLDDGVPIHAVQKRLGHKNVMTTLAMYGHPASDGEDRILAALDDL